MRPAPLSRPQPRLATAIRRLTVGSALLIPALAAAGEARIPAPSQLIDEKPADGHPTIILDQLKFPQDVVGAAGFESHLKKSLRREAYRADWGAGRENRIEYRFEVTELKYTLSDGALRIRCAAIGRLPGGQTAKSQLTFGGSQGERTALTKRVLEIVGRGVLTRLAELERKRRGLQ